jgi:hypothetical protein
MIRKAKFETLAYLGQAEYLTEGFSGYNPYGSLSGTYSSPPSSTATCGKFSIELECGHKYVFLSTGIGVSEADCKTCDKIAEEKASQPRAAEQKPKGLIL